MTVIYDPNPWTYSRLFVRPRVRGNCGAFGGPQRRKDKIKQDRKANRNYLNRYGRAALPHQTNWDGKPYPKFAK